MGDNGDDLAVREAQSFELRPHEVRESGKRRVESLAVQPQVLGVKLVRPAEGAAPSRPAAAAASLGLAGQLLVHEGGSQGSVTPTPVGRSPGRHLRTAGCDAALGHRSLAGVARPAGVEEQSPAPGYRLLQPIDDEGRQHWTSG